MLSRLSAEQLLGKTPASRWKKAKESKNLSRLVIFFEITSSVQSSLK